MIINFKLRWRVIMFDFVKLVEIIMPLLDVIKWYAFDIVLLNVIRLANVSFFQFLIVFVLSLAIIEKFAKHVARIVKKMAGY